MEEWKSIINYPNYEISNMGNCRNILTNNNLKYSINRCGYKKYHIYDENEIRKSLSLHRLLAIHFIPNPENKKYVDHSDNNKLNNSISNLRWVTRNENSRNRNSNKNTSSSYVGIHHSKTENKWKYSVNVNGKIHMKRFDTEKEAAIKRDEFILNNELEYFKLNFVHI
jgi:hypothetical protein